MYSRPRLGEWSRLMDYSTIKANEMNFEADSMECRLVERFTITTHTPVAYSEFFVNFECITTFHRNFAYCIFVIC